MGFAVVTGFFVVDNVVVGAVVTVVVVVVVAAANLSASNRFLSVVGSAFLLISGDACGKCLCRLCNGSPTATLADKCFLVSKLSGAPVSRDLIMAATDADCCDSNVTRSIDGVMPTFSGRAATAANMAHCNATKLYSQFMV